MPSSVLAVKNTASSAAHAGQRTSRVRGSVGSERTSCGPPSEGGGRGGGGSADGGYDRTHANTPPASSSPPPPAYLQLQHLPRHSACAPSPMPARPAVWAHTLPTTVAAPATTPPAPAAPRSSRGRCDALRCGRRTTRRGRRPPGTGSCGRSRPAPCAPCPPWDTALIQMLGR